MRMTKIDWLLLPPLVGVIGFVVFAVFQTVGFLGLGVLGLMLGGAALRIDMEQDGTVGSSATPELYARQIQAREGMSRSEKASRRAEAASIQKPLFLAKVVSAGLVILGFGFFALFQLG